MRQALLDEISEIVEEPVTPSRELESIALWTSIAIVMTAAFFDMHGRPDITGREIGKCITVEDILILGGW